MRASLEELSSEDSKLFFSFDGFETKCKIIDVYDGDTVTGVLYIDENSTKPICYKIRLYGINAPEMRPSRSIEDGERKQIIADATNSRDFLTSLVKDKIVDIECFGMGKYGRLLANIFVEVPIDAGFGVKGGYENGGSNHKCDRVCVNELLVQKGHANKKDY